jgi:NAD+ synthase (glutamine-hydrolysing)
LVLGSSNIAESLRGYMTKYDCSSADLNPIGGINKDDLKGFLKWFANKNNFPVFEEIANAKPTAELRPFDPNDAST